MDYKRRITDLQRRLEKLRLDQLLVTHMPNVRYLCGFTGSSGALLVGERGATLFTDGRYTLQAKREATHARLRIAGGNAAAAALASVKGRRKHAVGLEGDHLSVSAYKALRKATKSLLKPTSGLIERTRMIKDAEEIVQLHAAVMLASGLFDVLLHGIKPGTTESHVAAELEYVARRSGAEGIVHCTNSGDCTWYEFAREIVAQAGMDIRVLPATTDKFVRPASRIACAAE